MAGEPTLQQLVEAVREHLSERVLPTLEEPQLRFQTLVAAHLLGVVERELAVGEQPLWQDWALLTALLGERRAQPPNLARLGAEVRDLNQRLAQQIRAGERDDDPNVLLFLKRQVARKVEVWNPKFRLEP